MGIREDIMAENVMGNAADLAEARERELLERQAAMIAELRGLLTTNGWAGNIHVEYEKIDAILDKYEALK